MHDLFLRGGAGLKWPNTAGQDNKSNHRRSVSKKRKGSRKCYQSPAMEMHAGQFGKVRLGNVDVERLALADERPAVRRHVDDGLLRDLPHGAVKFLDIIRNAFHPLNRSWEIQRKSEQQGHENQHQEKRKKFQQTNSDKKIPTKISKNSAKVVNKEERPKNKICEQNWRILAICWRQILVFVKIDHLQIKFDFFLVWFFANRILREIKGFFFGRETWENNQNREVVSYLDGAVVGDDFVLHIVTPQAAVREILQEMLVDHLEFSRQHTAHKNVAGVGLDALVVAQNLRGTGGRHRRQQETVADAEARNLGLQRGPIVQVGRGDVPHVVLQNLRTEIGTLQPITHYYPPPKGVTIFSWHRKSADQNIHQMKTSC